MQLVLAEDLPDRETDQASHSRRNDPVQRKKVLSTSVGENLQQFIPCKLKKKNLLYSVQYENAVNRNLRRPGCLSRKTISNLLNTE